VVVVVLQNLVTLAGVVDAPQLQLAVPRLLPRAVYQAGRLLQSSRLPRTPPAVGADNNSSSSSSSSSSSNSDPWAQVPPVLRSRLKGRRRQGQPQRVALGRVFWALTAADLQVSQAGAPLPCYHPS
jgi:hypothetical protein